MVEGWALAHGAAQVFGNGLKPKQTQKTDPHSTNVSIHPVFIQRLGPADCSKSVCVYTNNPLSTYKSTVHNSYIKDTKVIRLEQIDKMSNGEVAALPVQYQLQANARTDTKE